MILEANRSALQIMKLDDSYDYFRAISTSTIDVNGDTWNDITWNTEDEKDSSFTHAADSATVTLAAGLYLVTYNVHAKGATTDRKSISSKVTLGGSDYEHGWGYSYIRGTDGCDDGIPSSIFLIDTASSVDLKVQASTYRDQNSATVNLVSGETGLTIVKLPDSTERLLAYSNNNQAITGGSGNILVHETEQTEDAAFSNNTTTGQVTINTSGNYLFGWSGYDEDVTPSANVRLR
jgi:hypothetical protein